MHDGRAGCGFLVDKEIEALVQTKQIEDIIPGRMHRIVLKGKPSLTLLSCYMPTGKYKEKKKQKDTAEGKECDDQSRKQAVLDVAVSCSVGS